MDRRDRTWQVLLWACIGAAAGAAPAPEERPELPPPVSPIVVPFQAGVAEEPAGETAPAVDPAVAKEAEPVAVTPALPAVPPTPPTSVNQPSPGIVAEAPLRWSWDHPDHASGIYHAKSDAKLTLFLDNTTKVPLPVAGQIVFGRLEGPAPGTFKALSVTPLSAATLQGGQRATIPLTVTFAAAGDYELRFSGSNAPIEHGGGGEAAGISLQCIFAPRPAPENAKSEEAPWLTLLPKAAVLVPGYLTDYVAQTSVRRFLIDERFAFDEKANLGLSFGASFDAPADEVNGLLAEAARAKATLVLRIAAPAKADPRVLAAFKEYLVDVLQRARGTVRAVVITPDAKTDAAEFRTIYLSAYETIKRSDKNIMMLGAGTAQATREFLLGQHLEAYVDGYALTDAAGQPALLADAPKRPLWVLPPAIADPWTGLPPAAALAQNAVVIPVPPPHIDCGVTAHLFSGAVLFQRVHLPTPTGDGVIDPFVNELPYIAVFQGDGYAVAAVAGFSAGTPLDARFPDLARTRTVVDLATPNDEPAGPNLEVGDDTRTMRVVDDQGSALDCRVGDQLYVPAGDRVSYVLQAGTADDLAGSLRPANTNHLPLFAISARRGATPDQLALHLENITPHELAGKIRIVSPPGKGAGEGAVTLFEKDFAPVAPGKVLEISADLAPHAETPDVPLILELITATPAAVIQRTAIIPR